MGGFHSGLIPPPHFGPKIIFVQASKIVEFLFFSKSPRIAPKIPAMYSLIGMKCRGCGLGPQALHGFKKKTNWVKKFIEVFGIC